MTHRPFLAASIERLRPSSRQEAMESLTVELATTPEEWAVFDGRALDDRVRELDVGQRRPAGHIASTRPDGTNLALPDAA